MCTSTHTHILTVQLTFALLPTSDMQPYYFQTTHCSNTQLFLWFSFSPQPQECSIGSIGVLWTYVTHVEYRLHSSAKLESLNLSLRLLGLFRTAPLLQPNLAEWLRGRKLPNRESEVCLWCPGPYTLKASVNMLKAFCRVEFAL